MAAIDATKTREKHTRREKGGVRGGDKQSWVGGALQR